MPLGSAHVRWLQICFKWFYEAYWRLWSLNNIGELIFSARSAGLNWARSWRTLMATIFSDDHQSFKCPRVSVLGGYSYNSHCLSVLVIIKKEMERFPSKTTNRLSMKVSMMQIASTVYKNDDSFRPSLLLDVPWPTMITRPTHPKSQRLVSKLRQRIY